MEQSVNLSISMSDDTDLDNTTSLLNHNVSFDSSMDLSKAVKPQIEENSSLPNVSFSLSEAERIKLKQQEQISNSNANRSQRSALCELSSNVENMRNISNSQSCVEVSIDVDEESTAEEDDSEYIINIEDTVYDEAGNDKTNPQVEQLYTEEGTSEAGTLIASYFEKQLVELGRRCWTSTPLTQHYTKGCYWSPDGTCLLVPVHRDGMHVIELPIDLYDANSATLERSLSKLQSAVHVQEGDTVYDCVWYPHMNSQQPETCFWLATRQHEPIHMWDAFDGRLRCSYSGYDEVDEVVAAISLNFSNDGQKIYAGYKRCIKIFDTSRPGRTYDEFPVKFAISCITQTTEHPHTVTCGNWHGYIQHFDLRCSPKQGPLFTLAGHAGGITQLRYNNRNGKDWQLFSGARMCSKLLQWDMRNYKKPLHEFQRKVQTNQRIQFDFSPQQSWLLSGDTDGGLNIWNLDLENETEALKLDLHADCCNGISFHPTLPIVASSSGQYHFIADTAHDMTVNTTAQASAEPELDYKTVVDYENAVLLLWCGDTSNLQNGQ